MTKNEWAAEVEAALGGGTEWRVVKVWVEGTSPMMYADLTSARLGTKRITLARDRFSTVAARRAEILRQMDSHSPPPAIDTGGPQRSRS